MPIPLPLSLHDLSRNTLFATLLALRSFSLLEAGLVGFGEAMALFALGIVEFGGSEARRELVFAELGLPDAAGIETGATDGRDGLGGIGGTSGDGGQGLRGIGFGRCSLIICMELGGGLLVRALAVGLWRSVAVVGSGTVCGSVHVAPSTPSVDMVSHLVVLKRSGR